MEKLLEREADCLPAPRLVIADGVTDFYAFTKDSFRLEGYEPCPFEAKIPIAV